MKTDRIVESIKKQFDERSERGQVKYGTTLTENDKDDYLQHLKEELMDAVLYIEKLQTPKKELIYGEQYWLDPSKKSYGYLKYMDEDRIGFLMVDNYGYMLNDKNIAMFANTEEMKCSFELKID